MSNYTPTDEQRHALALFQTGADLVIEAGAGAGKTSTLVLLAEWADGEGKRGQYLAFNRAIVEDSAKRFPSSVAARTIHSLAFRAIMSERPALKARLDGSRRISRAQEARSLGLTSEIRLGDKVLSPTFLAAHVMAGITRFCQSADPEPTERHIPTMVGLDPVDESGRARGPLNRQLAAALRPALQRAWRDLTADAGELRFDHAHYLKLWALSSPVIDVDYILFDEAQDVSPVMRSIVMAQQGRAQLVFVGDSAQAIYGFTGATNAMQLLDGNRCWLSKSFRFGAAVAAVANRLLSQMPDTALRIEGFEAIESTVGAFDGDPDALLCRTNAVAVREALDAMDRGLAVAIADSLKAQVISFAKAADELQERGSTNHRELAPFTSWDAVREFVETDPGGDELRLMVNLVDNFGSDVIQARLGSTVSETKADLVISTAHTSKGREWNRVRLAADFASNRASRTDGEDAPAPSVEETRLLYVAVTRAKLALDASLVPALNSEAVTEPEPEVAPEAAPASEEGGREVPGEDVPMGSVILGTDGPMEVATNRVRAGERRILGRSASTGRTVLLTVKPEATVKVLSA